MYKNKIKCIQYQLRANSDLFFYLFLSGNNGLKLKVAAQRKKIKKEFLKQISSTCNCHPSLVYKVLRNEVEAKDSLYFVANKQAKFDKHDVHENLLYKDKFIPRENSYKSNRTISHSDFKLFMERRLTTTGFKNSSELYELFIQEAEINPPLCRKTFYRYFKDFLNDVGSIPQYGKFRIIKSKHRKRGYYTAYKEKKNINAPKD
ncbi:hypothetical protein [Acinetobacter indicus]|uniref:hypothetical protein n=1 Tax=Acinetobacter indicus TaxID=756892 RepID=UPI0012E1AB61|nr:hypothetical protein [Acinetobacter indicus]